MMNTRKRTRKPTHPGTILKEDILSERNISVTEAAKYLCVTRKSLSEFINGKSKCSHLMARRLSVATDTTVGFWINLQANLDTWEAENLEISENIVAFPKSA